MKITVVIPALNEEKGIEATLKAVRSQSLKNLELIVADGASTDGTVDIAKKYCDKVVTETTRTIAAGRQAGARASGGDVILYTDADSVPAPDWAEKLSAAFNDEKVAAAFGSIEPIDGGKLETKITRLFTDLFAFVFNALGMDYTYGSNLAVRKSAFDKIGGFNIYLVTSEDTDIIHRIRAQGKVRYVHGSVVYYSMRRIRKWGWPKYILFHTKNFFTTFFFKTPAKHYEVVRE